jgi:hypothetical protein
VRILLGLRQPQIGARVAGHDIGEIAAEGLRFENHGQPEGPVVDGHRCRVYVRPLRAIEAVERVERDRPGDLTHAIGAEVETDHRVAVANRSDGSVVGVGNYDRFDELVGDLFLVRLLDGRGRRLPAAVGAAVDDRLVREMRAVPSLVAIHRVVPADDRGHSSGRGTRQRVMKLCEVADPSRRGRIAPVGNGVDEDAGDTSPRGHVDERMEMTLVTVHAAVGQEADEVQRVAIPGAAVQAGGEDLVVEQLAVLDALVDPR